MQRYFRIRELATTPSRDNKPGRTGRLPVAPATIWRWVKLGQFPRPVHLSGGVTAWPTELVEAWEQKRNAEVAS